MFLYEVQFRPRFYLSIVKTLRYMLTFAVLLFLSQPLEAQHKILSYNILSERYLENAGFDQFSYEIVACKYRQERILQKIMESSSDIVQLQEVEEDAFFYLKEHLQKEGYHAVFAFNPVRSRDSVATFYKKSSFEILSYKVHKFSRSTRVYLELNLKDKESKKSFTLVNVKLKWDNPDDLTHREGARQLSHLRKYMATLKLPFIITGDFNIAPTTPGIKKLVTLYQDAHQDIDCASISLDHVPNKIDYIFATENILLEPCDVISQKDDCIFQPTLSLEKPSDHFPISAFFNLKNT